MSLFEIWNERNQAEKTFEARRRIFEIERRSRQPEEIWVPNILNFARASSNGELQLINSQGTIRIKDPVTREEGVTAAEERLETYRWKCETLGRHQVNRPASNGRRTSF